MKTQLKEKLQVRIDEKNLNLLDKVATNLNEDRSKLVRRWIEENLKEYLALAR